MTSGTNKPKSGIDLTIRGWMSADPTFKTSATGKNVCSFSIPIQHADKRTPDRPLVKWFNCTVFDELALWVAENFRKGSHVICKVHYLQLWQDNNGNIRENYIISKVTTNLDDTDPTGGADNGGYDGPPI